MVGWLVESRLSAFEVPEHKSHDMPTPPAPVLTVPWETSV